MGGSPDGSGGIPVSGNITSSKWNNQEFKWWDGSQTFNGGFGDAAKYDAQKIVDPYNSKTENENFKKLALTWNPDFKYQDFLEAQGNGNAYRDPTENLQAGHYKNRASDLENMARSLEGKSTAPITLSNGVTLYSEEEKKSAAKMMNDSLTKDSLSPDAYYWQHNENQDKASFTKEEYDRYLKTLSDYSGGVAATDTTTTTDPTAPAAPTPTPSTLMGISAAEGQDLTEAEKLLRAKTSSSTTLLNGA